MARSISFEDACNQVLRCLSLCGIASSEQCARLVYSHTERPLKRIWSVLKYLRDEDYIETYQSSTGTVGIHRLSFSIRKQNQIPAVRWDTMLQHKLAVTDFYIDVHRLQCPLRWVREYRQFVKLPNGHTIIPEPDVYACINSIPCFIEIQCTPLSANRWTRKRQLYELYFHFNAWCGVLIQKPIVVILQKSNQQINTIGSGIGYDLLIVKSVDELITKLDSNLCLSGAF